MASKEKRENIFSSYPIPKAVAALAIPSVLSSIVNVIYNMADTYFAAPFSISSFWISQHWV